MRRAPRRPAPGASWIWWATSIRRSPHRSTSAHTVALSSSISMRPHHRTGRVAVEVVDGGLAGARAVVYTSGIMRAGRAGERTRGLGGVERRGGDGRRARPGGVRPGARTGPPGAGPGRPRHRRLGDAGRVGRAPGRHPRHRGRRRGQPAVPRGARHRLLEVTGRGAARHGRRPPRHQRHGPARHLRRAHGGARQPAGHPRRPHRAPVVGGRATTSPCGTARPATAPRSSTGTRSARAGPTSSPRTAST